MIVLLILLGVVLIIGLLLISVFNRFAIPILIYDPNGITGEKIEYMLDLIVLRRTEI